MSQKKPFYFFKHCLTGWSEIAEYCFKETQPAIVPMSLWQQMLERLDFMFVCFFCFCFFAWHKIAHCSKFHYLSHNPHSWSCVLGTADATVPESPWQRYVEMSRDWLSATDPFTSQWYYMRSNQCSINNVTSIKLSHCLMH